MTEQFDRSQQQTFDHGRIRALELAFATFLRMQQDVPLILFKEVYQGNMETWGEATLDMTVTDEYRRGVDFGARAIQSLLPIQDQEAR